jgi:hypothetical protein
VFCTSWRNPDAEDRDVTMDDYRRVGVMAALDAINAIAPDRKCGLLLHRHRHQARNHCRRTLGIAAHRPYPFQ